MFAGSLSRLGSTLYLCKDATPTNEGKKKFGKHTRKKKSIESLKIEKNVSEERVQRMIGILK